MLRTRATDHGPGGGCWVHTEYEFRSYTTYFTIFGKGDISKPRHFHHHWSLRKSPVLLILDVPCTSAVSIHRILDGRSLTIDLGYVLGVKTVRLFEDGSRIMTLMWPLHGSVCARLAALPAWNDNLDRKLILEFFRHRTLTFQKRSLKAICIL